MRIRWFCVFAVVVATFLFGCAHRVYTIGVDNPSNELGLDRGAKVSVKKLPNRVPFEYDGDLERKMNELLTARGYITTTEDSADFLVLYEYRLTDKRGYMQLELLEGASQGMQTVRGGGPFIHVLEVRLVDAELYRANRYSDSLIWEGGAVLGEVPTMSPKFHDMLLVAAFERIGASNVDGDSMMMNLNDSEARKLRQ